VAAVHEALATRLRTISGWNVSPYPTATFHPPMLTVEPDGEWLDPWAAFRHGAVRMRLTVKAWCSLASSDSGFAKLAELVSVRPSSDGERTATLHYCLDTDPTLGGVVESCSIQGAITVSYLSSGDTRYVVAEVPLLVLVKVG
jgi:hypothetical protein